jgi:hypothetical protein
MRELLAGAGAMRPEADPRVLRGGADAAAPGVPAGDRSGRWRRHPRRTRARGLGATDEAGRHEAGRTHGRVRGPLALERLLGGGLLQQGGREAEEPGATRAYLARCAGPAGLEARHREREGRRPGRLRLGLRRPVAPRRHGPALALDANLAATHPGRALPRGREAAARQEGLHRLAARLHLRLLLRQSPRDESSTKDGWLANLMAWPLQPLFFIV